MKKILCYGDSNTYGYNPDFTDDRDMRFSKSVRWTGVLQKELGDDYDVIEEGLGGRTTAWEDQTVSGRNGLKLLVPILQSHEPLDLVIIMLGTNDAKEIYNASVMEIGRGMEAIVKVCLSRYSYGTQAMCPKVLVVSPPLIGRNLNNSWLMGVFGEKAADKIKGLSAEYRVIAEKYGCDYFDAADIVTVSDTDSIHMDGDAHRILAHAIAEKVRDII